MAKYLPLPNGDSLKVPDDMTFEEAMAKAKTRFPELFEAPAAAPKKAGFSGGDTLRSVGQGALGGIKALTDVFGAGNAASNVLEAGTQRLQEGMTPGRKAELQRQAQRTKEAEASGDVKKEAYAALENFLEAPVQATAQGVGSLLPFAATSVAGGVAKLLPTTIRTIQTAMGAGMGAGAVKGSIYDAVYQQNIKDGRTPQEAHAQATAAQEYVGKNAEQIALGTGLGAVAARTGAEKLLTPGVEKGLAASAAKRVGKAVLEEVPLEATQGGQERLAANVALQREGVNVPTFQGVAGQAIQEGLAAGMAAGPLAAYRSPRAALAAKAREEEQAKRDAAIQAQEEAEAARRADPNYLPGLLQQSDAYTKQIAALKEASKAPDDADPVTKASAARAKAELKTLRESEEYKQHLAELTDAAPQLTALRAQQAQAAEAAAKAEQDAREARLNDPAVQGPLYEEFERLQADRAAAIEKGRQALQAGDMAAEKQSRDYADELTKQMQALQEQLGTRPEPPAPPAPEKSPVELQDDLVRLTGGVLSNGKKIAGAYASVQDAETLDALRQQVATIHQQLAAHKQRERDTQAAMYPTDLAREDFTPFEAAVPTRNEPGQAPTGDAAVDVAAEAAFGKETRFLQGDMRSGARTGPLQRNVPPTLPSTTQYEQDGLFADLEPGGNAGTPVENLRAQIEMLRSRPNMPQQTLAQLDNYARVLENPALADETNASAQNALEQITDNVRRIAYQGEGAGAERAMSVNELKARIEDIKQRRVQLGKNLGEAQAAVRNAAPEDKYARSNELRDLRNRVGVLLQEQRRLEAQLQPTETSYPIRPTKYVTLDPATGIQQGDIDATGRRKPVELQDATEEQIARAKRGDNRGREVAAVNAEPSTITEQVPLTYPGMEGDAVFRTEQRGGYEAPTATGAAKITRISERTIGQTRAGPSDAELNDTLRQLSPADEQTLNLWDPVFGADSPAARMVRDAEDGLTKAMYAVRQADTEVRQITDQLAAQRKAVAAAQAKDPYAQNVAIMAGQELGMRRNVEKAQERATAAAARAVSERSALTQNTAIALRTQQETIDEANRTMLAAQQRLRTAQAKFNAEFARLQRTGELTPELVKFVGTRSLKADLAQAQADIAAFTSGDTEFDTQARMLFDTLQKSASGIQTAAQARAMIDGFVPELRARLGERAAQLADTVLRLQAARNIVGVGMELKQAADRAQREAKQIEKDMRNRIKIAQRAKDKTLADLNKKLQSIGARSEIAQIELEAARQKLDAFERTLEDMRARAAELEGPELQQARATQQATERGLAKKTEALDELRRTENERIAEARTNLQRAKDTQQALFENERAVRNGEPMPLLTSIEDAARRLRSMGAEAEAAANAIMDSAQVDAADVAADMDTVKRQMDELDRVEAELTQLLQKHVSDFTEVQDEIATLVDTSALLESDVYDPDRENAQRIVDRAGLRAQVNALAEEEARTMTQRDNVIGAILRVIDTNAYQIANTPDPRYYKSTASDVNRFELLRQQRRRLFDQYAEKAALFTDRLQRIRDKKAALEPELYTAPDPALKDWGRTQIETLQGLLGRLQADIAGQRARIDSIRKARSLKVGEIRAQGEASLEEMRRLGLSDRQQRAPKLMEQLVASLKQQFVDMQKADKKVREAYVKMRKARSAVFAHDPYNDPYGKLLDLKDTAANAQAEFRAAALDRAKLHDDLVALERMQLSLAQEIVSTPPTREALPVPPARTETQESAQVTSEPVSPERWGSMTAALTAGRVSGPETEQEAPAIAEFRKRIESTDNVRGLRKELGSLRSAYAALIEAYETTPAGKTLSRENAALIRTAVGEKGGNAGWARELLKATQKAELRTQSLALFDKIRIVEERIADVASGRVPSLEQITATQPAPGRRGPVTKKETVAGDWRTGSEESGKGALATGTRNPATEQRVVKTPTAAAVVAQANRETGPQMVLRLQMEQAKLERDLDAARKQRAEAQERYDAVMAAPKASAAAKAAAEKGLADAKAAVSAADKKLTANTKAAPAAFRTAKASGPGMKIQNITALANKIMAEWTNTPPVRVVQSISDLPAYIREQAASDNRTDVPGVFDPREGVVYLVADGLYSPEDVMLTVAHEVSGHYGLRDLLGTGYSKLMNDIYNSVPEIAAEADQRMEKTPSLTREIAVEEIMADRAETASGKTGLSAALSRLFYAVKATVRNLLGKIGVKPNMLRISDAEVQQIVANARRHVKRGTPGGPKGGYKAASAQTAKAEAPAAPYRAPKIDTSSSLGKLASRITAEPTSPLERIGKNWALMLEMWGVDMRAPLMKALSVAGDKALTQAAYYVRKADALMNHVYAALGSGPLQLKKDAKGFFAVEAGNGPNMQAILDAVNKVNGVSVEDKMAKAQAYLVSERAARVGWDKLNFDAEAAKAYKELAAQTRKELQADPEQRKALEGVRNVYNEYNKGMVNFLAASGYLSKAKAAELLQHGDYVPFYRVGDNGLAEFVMGEGAIIHVGDLRNNKFLAPLVGDDQKLLPLNEAMIRNTMLLTDLAMKNLASKDVAYALQKIGVGKIRTGKGPAGEDVVRFRQEPNPNDAEDNGERYIRVNTSGTAVADIPSDMLVKSLEGSFATLPAGLKAAAWFGDILRAGVTRNPMYIARQLVRDPMAATFTGGLEAGMVKGVFKSLGNFTEQMAGRSKEGAELLQKGLLHSGIFTGDVDDINKMALQLTKGDQNAFKKTLAWWDKAAMNADAATRIQLYKDALGRGMSEVEAEFAAMEMMNFNKRGLSPTVQYAARMIPFLNAQIQSLNVLFKAMRGNMPQNEKLQIREKFYRRASAMALFTLAYAFAMEDDETYENARPRDRYSNWFLPNPMGGEHIKIPIPFEVGLLFKAVPEAMVDMMKGDFNDQEFKAIRGMFVNAIPGSSSYGLPQAVRPALEVVANHSFFTGREIESQADRGKVSQERFGRGTTELAKEMSQIINAAGIELSPKQIDHLIGGYLGSLPVIVARLANSLFDAGEGPVRPADRASDNPVFGSLFQREIGGGPVDAAYAQADALDKAKKSYDGMIAEGRRADAEAFKENVLNVLGSPEMANRWKTQSRAFYQQEQAARQRIKDPEQLRERLDDIERRRNEAAKMYLRAVEQIAQ